MTDTRDNAPGGAHLARQLGLLGLSATGICAMLGASINVVPFMIQRNVPGIGGYVLPAFAFAAVPALLAALAYGILSSAMPRAGGSYVYASRGLNPYLGFIASFSQWFGLSIVIGVIAYIIVPFLRDVALGLGGASLAAWLDTGWVRVSLALALVWLFVAVNVRGTRLYTRTLVPMMVVMVLLGAIVIVSGWRFDAQDYAAALPAGSAIPPDPRTGFPGWGVFLSASALLFSSFIGFDSIAQAGGEARNPARNLPLAIAIAILGVGAFYFAFTAAVYHAVPWTWVAREAAVQDISAPGLMAVLLPTGLSVAIIAGAAVALINDLPAMLLAVSRLMFAWARDGIFPAVIARVHSRRHTPHMALLASGLIASIGVLGSHFAGDFFLGIDIMVTAMLVNFWLMCATLLSLPRINPGLAAQIAVLRGAAVQRAVGIAGIGFLSLFIVVHVFKDLSSPAEAWYFHSTPVWLLVMAAGSLVFAYKMRALRAAGVDVAQRFSSLPEE